MSRQGKRAPGAGERRQLSFGFETRAESEPVEPRCLLCGAERAAVCAPEPAEGLGFPLCAPCYGKLAQAGKA